MKTEITLSLLIAGAIASAQAVPTAIYAAARSVKDQKITLQGWGSGTISETEGIALQGTTSVRVSSRNYFQGGTMTFGDPKDLAKKYDEKSNLLRVSFFLEDAGWVYGSTLRSSDKKGNNGTISRGGGAVRFGPGTSSELKPDPSAPFLPKIKNIRMIIATTDGKRSEAFIPVANAEAVPGAIGWRSVAIPLQAINGFDRTNKIIQSISMSTDSVSTMYVGSIDVATDDTPIRGEVVGVTKLNLALGDEATLTAYGEGGASALVFDWDFDDTDGIQIDDEGQVVKHKFRKPGTFKVTLTISDKYGLKKPFVTSFPVTVNP